MIRVNQISCTGCAMCLAACPQEAITCFGSARLNEEDCIDCLDCIAFCPNDALVQIEIKGNICAQKCL